MRRLIHTWLHPDSKGSVHLTCITTLLKWKSPSREGRIQFNHTLWKAMSTSLALQIRSTSRCRTYFIPWESDEKTASGNKISLSHIWAAKIKSLLCLKTTHALYLLTYCNHIISPRSLMIWLKDGWSMFLWLEVVQVWEWVCWDTDCGSLIFWVKYAFLFLPKVRWEDQNTGSSVC